MLEGPEYVAATRAAEVAQELEGSCRSLYEVASEAEQNDPLFCDALDQLVFQCDTCGWWGTVDELDEDTNHGQLCADCADDQRDG